MPTEIKGSDSRETRVVSPVSKNSDEADDANAIIEVRAGTGGDEAALFTMEMFQMYER